jgi:hypothetical protein
VDKQDDLTIGRVGADGDIPVLTHAVFVVIGQVPPDPDQLKGNTLASAT